jgi:hypothetical protein
MGMRIWKMRRPRRCLQMGCREHGLQVLDGYCLEHKPARNLTTRPNSAAPATFAEQVRSLDHDEIRKRYHGLARSAVPEWPEEVFRKVVKGENLVLALYETVSAWEKSDKRTDLDSYIGKMLRFQLWKIDQRQRPHMYDENDVYLGAEAEEVEGLSGVFPDEEESPGKTGLPPTRKKRAREDVPDYVPFEALRRISLEAGEEMSFPRYLDKATNELKHKLRYLPIPGRLASSLPGPVRLLKQTWENNGEQLSGRDAARALGWPSGMRATAAAVEAANVIAPLLEIGGLQPPSPKHRRSRFNYHPHI